jgi:hypothetical protein
MNPLGTRLLWFSLLLATALAVAGCGGGNGTAPSIFFTVHTTVTVNGISNPEPNVSVGGFVPLLGLTLANACSQNPGGVNSFGPVATDSNGNRTVANAAIGPSCTWEFSRDVSQQCPVATINDQITVTNPNAMIPLPCGVAVNTFVANPHSFDPANPPATVTITGQNMLATYAMPKVDIYDQNHTLYLEVTALSASSDGTTLVFPSNQITFTGRFAAVVYVQDANGTWDAVGGADINVSPPPPPPPTGGGGCTGRNCLPQN